MFGTLLGMAPLCYVQAHLAETLLEAAPWLLWPLLVCGVLYLAAVAFFVARAIQRGRASDAESGARAAEHRE